MIGFRGLTALALACAASALACSSSSSSGGTPTKFTCATSNPMTEMDQSCLSCIESSCGSEATTAYGSGFASEDITGGACGSFISCIAACACNDIMCAEKCTPTTDCETASTAVGSCESSKCSVCGASAGGGGDAGGSTGVGTGTTEACNVGSTGICIEGVPSTDCASTMGGMAVSSCPTANLVGCCTATGIKSCYYAPLTAADAMMVCSATMGTFSTSM